MGFLNKKLENDGQVRTKKHQNNVLILATNHRGRTIHNQNQDYAFGNAGAADNEDEEPNG